MKTWVRKTLSVGVLTAGALLLAPTAAQAADIQQATSSDGDTDGVLNNLQVAAPIDVPINLCSVAAGVLGDGYAASECSNQLAEHSITQGATGETNGILNNAQVAVPVQVPVNVIGVAAGVLGDASAEGVGKNGGSAATESARAEHKAQGQAAGGGDVDGIGNNIQAYVPVHVPVNAGGIAIGDAKSAAKLSNGGGANGHGAGEGAAIQQSAGGETNGILNNAQVAVPVDVPINLCGVAVGLLGDGEAAADCKNSGGGAGEGGIVQGTGGGETDGVLNNLQVAVPVNVPINICGIAAGVLGDGEAAAQCGNGDDNGTGVSPEQPDSHYPGDDEEPADEEPTDEEPVDEEPADEEPADEEPTDEAPVDEEPADEEPADEEPVDEEPVDEEPVDDGSGNPSGDYDGVSPDAYGDGADAAAGRHARESLALPGLDGLTKGNNSDANLGGLPLASVISGLLG
ncbi:hypothetical protein [Catenuloplanes atrovinosus]|uniref:Chaplin domain-containing protein n=1 Tax=Catenuloplanes atrovinosus TaxID=137266 RepID=A0AAE3YUE0_9ACTN|nr:hypothetical protein [Catenuloplanes atrovinosus]MDR7280084.1 hypothetical protein [Catenuloplanes atrovinosus]